MRKNPPFIVEQVRAEWLTCPYERLDAFGFREDRPAHWLQRLCLWILRKLHCEAPATVENYFRHAIPYEQELWKAIDQAYECTFDWRGVEMVIMGPDEFRALAQDKQAMRTGALVTAAFQHAAPSRRPGGYAEYRLYNVPVRIAPDMRGIVFLPRE